MERTKTTPRLSEAAVPGLSSITLTSKPKGAVNMDRDDFEDYLEECFEEHNIGRDDFEEFLGNLGKQGRKKKRAQPADVVQIINNARELRSLKHDLCCPIGGTLIRDPVIAEDEHTYERDNITKWFLQKASSPTTNLLIGKSLISCHSTKSIIETLLNMNGVVDDKEAAAWHHAEGTSLVNQGELRDAANCFKKALSFGHSSDDIKLQLSGISLMEQIETLQMEAQDRNIDIAHFSLGD